jgi:sterol desaturase/sphingolipid hydroxylase (fatty acid hydroxylase superfamily)
MSLGELWAAYLTYPAIQIYAVLAVASAVAAGLCFRGWARIGLAVLATLVVYPFAWYLIHRVILHGRWLYRMRWTAGLWKRIHFDHHQDPHLLEVLFGAPANTVPTIAVITLPLGYAVGGPAGAAAAFGTGLLTTCVYEFCHCIQHLNYKPRSRLLQYLKQRHLLHHFHDQDGNYGIVSFLPDRLFGSYYMDAKSRPRSPHVFNLGYDLNEARRYPWVMQRTGAPPRDRPPGASPARRRASTAAPR